MHLYLALLRGVNVGGSNLIRMPALKVCFEALGFREVATYIQSGNVVFAAGRSNPQDLVRPIERALSRTFVYESRVVLCSFEQLKAIVEGAPKRFGAQPTTYRYDVVFLKHPLTPADAMKGISAKPGVDQVVAGDSVLYFSRLISKATESRLTRIVGTPAYRNMTIRSWTTTAKLLQLMEGIRISASKSRLVARVEPRSVRPRAQ